MVTEIINKIQQARGARMQTHAGTMVDVLLIICLSIHHTGTVLKLSESLQYARQFCLACRTW